MIAVLHSDELFGPQIIDPIIIGRVNCDDRRRASTPDGRWKRTCGSTALGAFSENRGDFPAGTNRISTFVLEWRAACMAKPYSEDLRTRVVGAGQDGATIPETAEQLGVSISSVVRFRRLHRETGSASDRRRGAGGCRRVQGVRRRHRGRL